MDILEIYHAKVCLGEVKIMPCGKKTYIRVRAVDVGRKGHHYIKIGVRMSKGRRGGRTFKIGKLRTYKRK
jgi:hypothetical protein